VSKRQPTHCRQCSTKLGERRVVVNDAHGMHAHFCTAACYADFTFHRPAVSVQALHADLDTLMPTEGLLRLR